MKDISPKKTIPETPNFPPINNNPSCPEEKKRQSENFAGVGYHLASNLVSWVK